MNFFQYLIRTMNSSRSLILFVAFSGFFFVRTTLMPLAYDDYSYSFVWDGENGGNLEAMQNSGNFRRVESFADIFQSMWSHYFTWGGRIFAYGLAQFFLWFGKPIFDIANTVIFIFLILVIVNLANTWLKISRAAIVWIFLSLIIFASSSLISELWLTGSCNYLWMSFFQLFFLTPYVKALRSHEASNSALNIVLMSFLGLLAGWSNESGALSTIFLTIFLVFMCKAQKIFRAWMISGLAALIIACGFMLFAPGNFARLAFFHANFAYTSGIFFEHLIKFFTAVFIPDLIALLPMFIYFLRRSSGKFNTPEILMLAFAAAGLFVPVIMLFFPEFSTRISVTSINFVLVASTSAILELERQNFSLSLYFPKKILRGVSIILTSLCISYLVTLIYVDISVFNAARRQVRYIKRNSYLDIIPMPLLPVRHRFEDIHGDRSAVFYLKFLGGIEKNPNFYQNVLVAKYYGVRGVVGVDD